MFIQYILSPPGKFFNIMYTQYFYNLFIKLYIGHESLKLFFTDFREIVNTHKNHEYPIV